MCVNAGFVASDWAWLQGPVLGHRRLGLAAAIGGRVPKAVVTFKPREDALGAWQEVKGEAMSVNEALYAGAIEGTVRLDGSGRWFKADVVATTCCYPAHTGNEVSSCVGGVAERP